jgi:hypothetical protein
VAEELDPDDANHIFCTGRKGSGKSELARSFWESYPYDRLVIDPTGDVKTGDPKTVKLELPLPSRWPSPSPFREHERTTLRFVPDFGSPTYVDDMDRALGLAFNHGGQHKKAPHHRCLAWVDEVGELTGASRTPPAMKRVLHQSRHKKLSLLFCGPRPIDINKLVLTQADFIAVFPLPARADRERIAEAIGMESGDFEDAHRELMGAGKYWYLWWAGPDSELELRPPIPHANPQATTLVERYRPTEATGL